MPGIVLLKTMLCRFPVSSFRAGQQESILSLMGVSNSALTPQESLQLINAAQNQLQESVSRLTVSRTSAEASIQAIQNALNESQESRSSVSRSNVSECESISRVLHALVGQQESYAVLAKTLTAANEHLLKVQHGLPTDFESTGLGLAVLSVIPMENRGAVKSAKQSAEESFAKIQKSTQEIFEVLASVSGAKSSPLEAKGRILKALSENWEALGRLAGVKTSIEEWKGPVSKSAGTVFEAYGKVSHALGSAQASIKRLAVSGAIFEASLKSSAHSVSSIDENLGHISTGRSGQYEERSRVSHALASLEESVQSIRKSLTEVQESLAGAKNHLQVPSEVLGYLAQQLASWDEAHGIVISSANHPAEGLPRPALVLIMDSLAMSLKLQTLAFTTATILRAVAISTMPTLVVESVAVNDVEPDPDSSSEPLDLGYDIQAKYIRSLPVLVIKGFCVERVNVSPR